MKQEGDAWLAWRRAGIGGSDASIILGINPWRSRWDLYRDKTGQAEPQVTNAAMQRGIDLEPWAREAYEAATKRIVQPLVMEHREWPVMRASLDGLSFDGAKALEIKCPGMNSHVEFTQTKKLPAIYLPQVQHILAVSQAASLDFVSYHPDADIPIAMIEDIRPDPEYIAWLMEEERKFWDQVLGVTPPPPAPVQPEQRLDTNWQQTALLYREAEAGMAEWESKKKAARERLISLMGQSTRATGGGLSLTKLSKTTTNYAQAAKDAGLDLQRYETTREEWRVTLVKEK